MIINQEQPPLEESKSARSKTKRVKVDAAFGVSGGSLLNSGAIVRADKPSDVVVTPELLMSKFQHNYMLCTQLQKKGVRKVQELSEQKLKKAVDVSRQEWSNALNLLLEKQERLESLLRSMGLVCPESLLGVPAQQLDKLERVTFWGRTVCVDLRSRHSSEAVVDDIQALLNDVTELKVKVKSKQQVVHSLSTDLIAYGNRHQAALTDCLTLNTPLFSLEEVLSQSVYNPVFDHNDVFHQFADPQSVVSFYATLPERCLREQCVPLGVGLEKMRSSVKPTVDHLGAGFFVGLMVITNLDDLSDGNDVVNHDHMCCSVAEQLSGTSLQPGKKYVTWYIGQYAHQNAMGSLSEWTQGMDYLFYSLSKCPAGCSTEFLKAWKGRVGAQRPLYTCVLPGTKEVTGESWGTTDTLDWIARSVHFWAHQLNTYAPSGYNMPLSHHFHRTLFLEIPKLVKFPLLWQYKELLGSTMQECRLLVEDVQRASGVATEFLSAMKQDFCSCNFHLVFYQWEPVQDRLKELEALAAKCDERMGHLQLCLTVIQQSVETKLTQVSALSRLCKVDVTNAVPRYSSMLQAQCVEATELLRCVAECKPGVTVQDMELFAEQLKNLEPCTPEWVLRLCESVGVRSLSADHFFTQFKKLKTNVKQLRNKFHPDKGSTEVARFYECQSWCEQLESIENFLEHFFNKVR